MYVILGGTGHIGSAVATTLLERGESVTVVGHDPSKAEEWRQRGATFAVVDVNDADALREILKTGRRAFLLNPPADVSGDTDTAERASAAAIVTALDGSGLEKVVAQSAYGAQPGDAIGDLSVLYEFEQQLVAQPIPVAINRGAYYFSNFDMMLDPARDEGVIQAMFPPDMVMPMVAPEDLGDAAVRRLLEPVDATGIFFIEGPERHSFADVAVAFAHALGREVRAETVPDDAIEATFRAQGFSPKAASAFSRMTRLTRDHFEAPDNPERGKVALDDYIAELVARSSD